MIPVKSFEFGIMKIVHAILVKIEEIGAELPYTLESNE